MQLVHETVLTSTYHNPSCSFWIVRRFNFNFKSMAAKMLYDVNFDGWFQLKFLLELLHTLWILGLLEEVCVVGMLKCVRDSDLTRRPYLSSLSGIVAVRGRGRSASDT